MPTNKIATEADENFGANVNVNFHSNGGGKIGAVKNERDNIINKYMIHNTTNCDSVEDEHNNIDRITMIRKVFDRAPKLNLEVFKIINEVDYKFKCFATGNDC
jgi:hypothetical protein